MNQRKNRGDPARPDPARPGPRRFCSASFSETTQPILMKFCTHMGTLLNFCVLDFGKDSLNRQDVAETNVDPPFFQFFAYNSKTMRNFENLKAPSFRRI